MLIYNKYLINIKYKLNIILINTINIFIIKIFHYNIINILKCSVTGLTMPLIPLRIFFNSQYTTLSFISKI